MERYIGCLLCGVRKSSARFENCSDEVGAAGIKIIPGYEEHTHIWTEMVVASAEFGKGLLQDLKINS